MAIVFTNDTKLSYSNVGKQEKKSPCKTLTVVSKPSVLCPFTKGYATVDRCRMCSNYAGFVRKGAAIVCRNPY